MSPCAGRNTIAALLAGVIDGTSVQRLEGHLDACASCRQLIAELGRGLSSLAGPRARPAARLPRLGERVDRYTLRRLLGVGGMGVVFEAHDPTLGRRVALKLVRPDLIDELSPPQLLDEARAMARVQHPNVVTVYDAGVFADQLYVCMEYVPGTTLRAWITARSRSTREILDAFAAAGAGLAHVHHAGLVHLDFKPDNVLVATTGRFVVSDFGLTRMVRGQRSAPGVVAGTPAYMAPEQKLGAPTDARADQYSFSAALREALGDRAPRWLARIIARGMASAPSDRYPSMDAVLAALAAGRRERPGRRIVAAAAVLGATVLAATRPSAPDVRFIDRPVDRPVVLSVAHATAAPALPAPEATALLAADAPATTTPRASAARLAPPAPHTASSTRAPSPMSWAQADPLDVDPPDPAEPFPERCDDGSALTCELDFPRCPMGAIAAIRAGCWTCADERTCGPPGAGRADHHPGERGLIAALGPSTSMSSAGTLIARFPAPGSFPAPGAGGGGTPTGSSSAGAGGGATGSIDPGSGAGSVCDCGGTDTTDCGCPPGSTGCRCGTSGGTGTGSPVPGGGTGTGSPVPGGGGGGGTGTGTPSDGGTGGTGNGGTGGTGTTSGGGSAGTIGGGSGGGSQTGCNCGGGTTTPGGGTGTPIGDGASNPGGTAGGGTGAPARGGG